LRSRWWLSPLDNPPEVNGLHHPTGVYDYRSTDHLLPYKVLAAQSPCQRENWRPDGPFALRTARPTSAL
ncbi:MAG: hypothetical protein KDA61_14035, partial [Planctomycetales bacterium]|nr:hypothetical protein [Planctomycetales bacterium]